MKTFSMLGNIHRWLISRLVIVWLVLSVVIGSLVHYLGEAHLDHYISTMAQSETLHYTPYFTKYLNAPSENALALFNKTIQTLIEKDNIVVVEFYDVDSLKVTEVVKPGAVELEKRLPKHNTNFIYSKGIEGETLTVDSETFQRVFVPIYNGAGKRIGYLEGVYRVPVATIAQIRSQTLLALILVVVIIFVTTLVLYPFIIRLNSDLLEKTQALALTNIGMLRVLGSAISKRDSDTNFHNFRVALYSVRLGEKLRLSSLSMQGLIKGSFLHDVGKIAIPDAILLKPGKLTFEEFETMKTHVGHGEDIICSYEWLKDADEVVRFHHEKFDGSGYPSGVAGDDIPINARIFAVADVFDALTSKRPYKEPFSVDDSIKITRESRGSHFDPAIVDLFLEHAEELYGEICREDENLLDAKLEVCLARYF